MKKLLIILISHFTGNMVFAQTVAQDPAAQGSSATNPNQLLIIAIWVVIIVSIIVLLVAIYAVYVLKNVLTGQKTTAVAGATPAVQEKESESWFQRITKNMMDAVPVEKEEEVMLDHNYDGIRELDNHLPPWWKWLFFFTIGWAALYLMAFHVFHVFPLSHEEYNRQMARAAQEIKVHKASLAASIDENNVVFSDDPAIINDGKDIFAKNCTPCHAVDGGGGIGPNLTDKYWIHGGSLKDIFRTIKYGVPEKGMITWMNQLSPSQIRDVACFVHTLQGTKPAKPKDPQGTLYVPSGNENVKPDSTSQGMVNQPADSTVAK